MKPSREKDSNPAKSLRDEGEEFYLRVLGHFHADRSELTTIPCMPNEDSAWSKPIECAGEQFLTELTCRFHNDRSYLEVYQPSQVAA